MVLTRVVRGPAPDYAVRLHLEADDGVRYVLDVRTGVPVNLDVQPVQAIDVSLVRTDGTVLTLSDETGILLLLTSGHSLPPDRKNLPLRVLPTQERVMLEVSSPDEDLCQRTWAHQFVDIEADGRIWRMPPGRSGMIEAGGARYLVSIAACRMPEEADCGVLGDREVAFAWSRMPRDDAAGKR